jgi:hypothetical protein
MIGAACQKGTMHDFAASGVVPHGHLLRPDASKLLHVANDKPSTADRLQAGRYGQDIQRGVSTPET